jgi:hypothetical protein
VTPRTLYTFRTGLQALGGNFFGTGSGRFGEVLHESRVRGRLTYALWDSPGLRQVVLGDFTPFGVLNEDVFGAEITNRPASPRVYFSDEQFDTHVEAGEQIDVLSEGQIIETATANQTGTFSANVPMRYGSNDIAFHMYNRWGEQTITDFKPFVPRDLLKPDEFRYSVSGGKLRLLNDSYYANGTLQYGFNSRVTLGTTLESFESQQTTVRYYPSLFAASRLSTALLFSALFSPSLQSTASLNLQTANLSGGTLSVTHYALNSILNTRHAISQVDFSGILPFFFKNTQAGYLQATAQHVELLSEREQTVSGTASIFLKAVQPLVTLNAHWASRPGGLPDTLDLYRTQFGLLARLPLDILFLGQAEYDNIDHAFSSVFYEASYAITPRFLASIAYSRYFSSVSSVFLQLSYGLPFATVQAATRKISDEYQYQERVSGSIGFSSQTGDVIYDRVPNRVGYGDIILNPYIDENNNDRYDPGEKRVSLTRMRAFTEWGPTYFKQRPDGDLELSRSLAYETYRVYPDPVGLDNPIWVPKYSSFSVESYPSYISRLDIPIVEGGIVRGSVTGLVRGGPGPVEGAQIIISSVDSVQLDGHRGPLYIKKMTTFSTGEYEFFPIPPGDYLVSLDPHQVESMGYHAATISRRITIRSIAGGDVLEGINFELK